MKIVQINNTCGIGSTGKICVGISEILTEKNIENYILYSSKTNGYNLGIKCSNDIYIKIQALKSRVLGNYGFNSKRATKKIISELDRIRPDIVHLHNIHGHDCDLEELFMYFKRKKTKLYWTFHDCWTFTAYCPHFTMAKCGKWKNNCYDCVQKRDYTWLFDKSESVYRRKKKLFLGLDLTIITPSQWLADLVKKSFFKEYPIKVIYNGIDLNIFQPTQGEVRKKYGIDENKIILLGVAYGWGEAKGLDVFIELSKRLEDKYQIVLVGTNSQIDKKLPDSILSINKTHDQRELAELYTASNILLNPTREEVLGLVNIEALACGTPVITFKSGGSPECFDPTSGSIVECDNIEALEKEIIRICTDKPYTEDACIKRSKLFDKNDRFREYVELYENFTSI